MYNLYALKKKTGAHLFDHFPAPSGWYIKNSMRAVIFKHKVQMASQTSKQGKSEGFESCDQPIVRKRPIWVKIGDVLSHVTFAVSSFVQHFIAIGEFKLELQSGNAQFGSNSTIFFSHMTSKFDRWHWKTIGHLLYTTSSFVHHFIAIGESKLELQSGNAQFGSNSTIFRAVWPWNFTYDLEKQ